jgi:hypothetical protein
VRYVKLRKGNKVTRLYERWYVYTLKNQSGAPVRRASKRFGARQAQLFKTQNMTKRHRNLSYDIPLERYGCLLSTPFYGMTF